MQGVWTGVMRPDGIVPEDKSLHYEIQAVLFLHHLDHSLYSAAPLTSFYYPSSMCIWLVIGIIIQIVSIYRTTEFFFLYQFIKKVFNSSFEKQ
jgi:hypothetical protein